MSRGATDYMTMARRGLIAVGVSMVGFMAIYAANARVIEDRSIASRLLQDRITFRNWRAGDVDHVAEFEQQMDDFRTSGRDEFVWPSDLELVNSVEREDTTDGMTVYVVNEDGSSDTTVLYYHGGGYTWEMSNLHVRFVDRLATSLDAKIIVPIYPLAPLADHAVSLDVGLAHYRQLVDDGDASKLVVFGESAGGGYALSLMLSAKNAEVPLPSRVVLASPWLDVTLTNPKIDDQLLGNERVLDRDSMQIAGRLWAGDADMSDPLVSPLFGHVAGLPPVDLLSSTYDLLHPDIVLLRDELRANNNAGTYREYDKMLHSFYLSTLPESQDALDTLVAMIEADG